MRSNPDMIEFGTRVEREADYRTKVTEQNCSTRVKMVDYKVTVSTTNLAAANTLSNVFIKLVGRDGESDRKWLLGLKGVASFFRGAYDYGGWMPNTPIALQLLPPTAKGTTSEATMLQTFPDVNTTAQGMSTMWLLSKRSSDFVRLGQYNEDHFTEEVPRKLIRLFKGELEVLSTAIKVRNRDLEIPYTYLDPEELENSVAI